MSLLVWLPLNGNLENQGLSDLQFSLVNYANAITSSSSGGKVVPGLYKRTTKETADYIISNKSITLAGDVTMCCWAKVTGVGYAGTANGIVSQHGHLTGGLGITMKDVSSTDLRMSVNTGLYGDSHGSSSDRTYCSYYGSTNIYNAWHHLCLTYKASTRQLQMFVDGKLETTNVGTTVNLNGNNTTARPIVLFAWSTDHLGSSIPNYRPPCELNDVRIYDEVLSKKQIKEIAKGLAAHYQLKGMGRTNYCKGSGAFTKDNPLIRNATDVSHMNDSYIYHNGVLSATVPSDGTYTWVLEADGTPDSSHPTSNASSSSRLYSMWLQNTSTGNHYLWAGASVGPDGKHYGTVNIPAGTYNVRTNLYAGDSTNYIVKFWNIKLIQGSYDPSDIWCPNENDTLYGKLELGTRLGMDSSGFGRHLTKSGVIPIVGKSAKYGSCVDFNQTGYLKNESFNMTTNAFTIAFWINPPYSINAQHFICGTFNNWTGNGFGMWRDSTGGGYSALYRSNSEGSYTGLPGFTATHDTWQHVAYVYTGTQGIYYKNGVEISRVNGGSGGTVSHPVLYLGNSRYNEVASQTDEACLSDFRFYATALSAADIAELYGVSASVDRDGNFFAYDFHENKRNSIDKDGVAAFGGFDTKAVPLYDMKVKGMPDGSTWARIYHLDVNTNKTFFANDTEVAKCINKPNRFSRMGIVDKFKVGSEYEFMLTYPSLIKTLPSGYTALEYVETNGSQYVRTGVYPYSSGGYIRGHRWELDMSFSINGIRQLMGYGPFGYEYWGMSDNGYYEGMSVQAGTRDLIVHEYSNGTAGGNTLWVNNGQRDVGANLETSYEYTLFALNWPGGPGYYCYSKLYRCKCIQGTSIIRDFVPARRNSDNVVGLYDIVNNVFYTSSGSSLIAGPVASTTVIPLYNRWIQTISPNSGYVTSASGTGYKPINTSFAAYQAPLTKSASSGSSTYSANFTSNWWAPVGQKVTFSGGIPAADGSTQYETELWVRTDRFGDINQFKIYNGSVSAKNYIEL